MSERVGIVDLFAGPGGLGEGFSSFSPDGQSRPFQIAMSVEFEPSAHRTLQLRAFFRQFGKEVPDAYYQYLKGKLSRDGLMDRFPEQAQAAIDETMGQPLALGNVENDRIIHARLRSLRRKSDNPWVVIGGPPCQAYSLVGRARNKGIKNYRPEKDHRHFLYEEYLKTLDILQPAVFVMENVKGLLSSRVEGNNVFDRLIEDLADPSKAVGRKRKRTRYRIFSLVPDAGEHDHCRPRNSDFLIRSELFGVPQARHRVIVVGVLEELHMDPSALKPAGTIATVDQVLGALPKIRSGLSKGADSPERWRSTVGAAVKAAAREFTGSAEDLERVASRNRNISTRGGRFQKYRRNMRSTTELDRWLIDERLGGFTGHESRAHIETDIARYLYCSFFASQNNGRSPRAQNFPKFFVPKHTNWGSGKFVDRFKVQARGRPANTVTSHISKDGHYYIHYDPAQCRSLTVREAARLQTFPDNYLFEGNRTQQYVQVGNAVPPWLAKQIAEVVFDVLSNR